LIALSIIVSTKVFFSGWVVASVVVPSFINGVSASSPPCDIFALMYKAAKILIEHKSALIYIQFKLDSHPPYDLAVKMIGGMFNPNATERYRQNGERHTLVIWSVARPHALQGRVRTVPTASHVPRRILEMDSHRMAAIIIYLLACLE
jgi:hypothetical protein